MDDPVCAAWFIHRVLKHFRIFLSHRRKYQDFLENGVFNLALVFFYNLLCYLLTGLPSDQSVFSPPAFFAYPGARMGFWVVGWGIIGASVLIMGTAVRQRKSWGGRILKRGFSCPGFIDISGNPSTSVLYGRPWGWLW